MTTGNLPKLLNTDEVSQYLGVPKRTLERWRLKGSTGGPPFVQLGKHVRYPEDRLARWIDEKSDG